MKTDLLTTEELREKTLHQIENEWVLLIGDQDLISSFERAFFWGNENRYFEATISQTADGKTLFWYRIKLHSKEAKTAFMVNGQIPIAVCAMGLKEDGHPILWDAVARDGQTRKEEVGHIFGEFWDIFMLGQHSGDDPYMEWLKRNKCPLVEASDPEEVFSLDDSLLDPETLAKKREIEKQLEEMNIDPEIFFKGAALAWKELTPEERAKLAAGGRLKKENSE